MEAGSAVGPAPSTRRCVRPLGRIGQRPSEFVPDRLVGCRDAGRILGHGRLSGLEVGQDDLHRCGDGHGQEGPEGSAGGGAHEKADEDEERRDADAVAHHDRHQDAALGQLEDDVDTRDDQRELRRDGRCDEHAGIAPSRGPTMGMASVKAAIRPSRMAPGTPRTV